MRASNAEFRRMQSSSASPEHPQSPVAQPGVVYASAVLRTVCLRSLAF
jgi:hypothetical protein